MSQHITRHTARAMLGAQLDGALGGQMLSAAQVAERRSTDTLPVDEVLASIMPGGGVQRGSVIGCGGQGAVTLAASLIARAVVAGSWVCVVGMPWLNVEAVADAGVPLQRLVRVAGGANATEWAERVAAAVDGFDLVLTTAPAGVGRVERRVRNRVKARRGVVVAVACSPAGHNAGGMSTDLTLTTSNETWLGVDGGAGLLRTRRCRVTVSGRRCPLPLGAEVLLPTHDGRLSDNIDTLTPVVYPGGAHHETAQHEAAHHETARWGCVG